jgi:large conductance mechanosensitive channel
MERRQQMLARALQDFQKFLLRGNVVDLAIAVVIGAAFGAVVKSVVEDLITPLIGIVGKKDFSAFAFTVRGSTFRYGEFVNEVIAFVIVAAVVYFLVLRPINALIARSRGEAKPVDPTTRKCPECLSEVPIAARRCAFCTSELAPAAS